MSRSYLLGALHDGTLRPRTVRISQKEETYILLLRDMVKGMGCNAWAYREGRDLNLFVVEFSRFLLVPHRIKSVRERIDHIRGYFDAEGGVPARASVAPYIYPLKKAARTWLRYARCSFPWGSHVADCTIPVDEQIPVIGGST